MSAEDTVRTMLGIARLEPHEDEIPALLELYAAIGAALDRVDAMLERETDRSE